MQTPRDVLNALIHRKKADRLGLMENPWGDTIAKWVTQGYPTNKDGQAVPVQEHFKFDMAHCGGWLDWQPKMGHNETVAETDEWAVRKNGAGASLKWWKAKSGTPEHVDFAMTTREIWEREYRPLVVGSAAQRLGADDVRDMKKSLEDRRSEGYWTCFGTQFLWEDMRASMGDMTLYTAMLLDPEWIHDYCRVYTDLYKEYYTLLLAQVGVPDGVWLYEDLGYRDRLFVAPEIYRDTIFVYYAEMVEFFHSYGVPVILHTCGYTEPAMDLIVNAGFDGLNPLEVKAGNDIFKMAEKYGDKLSFWGGLDARILESGDRAAIRRGVIDFIEGLKKRGACVVFASDHSLSTNVHYDDYRYALEVYHEHKAY
ncbi:MAG: uroporphyrinogen decarboxylase family protein [Planctomycetota bacterium]